MPTSFYYGEGHGGVELGSYFGGNQLNGTPDGARRLESYAHEVEPEFDDKHCKTWKAEGVQCGAYPVKEGPHAGVLCQGHINTLEASTSEES